MVIENNVLEEVPIFLNGSGMGGCPMIAQTLVNLLLVLEHVCQV
jgi:hypothetical protein